MLSSDHDGERVGAVAAIERVLKSHDCDWHDLVASDHRTGTRPRAAARQAAERRRLDTMDAEELVDLITRLRDSGAWLGSAVGSNFSTDCSHAPAATTRSSSAPGSDNGLMTSPAEPEVAS